VSHCEIFAYLFNRAEASVSHPNKKFFRLDHLFYRVESPPTAGRWSSGKDVQIWDGSWKPFGWWTWWR